MADHRHKYPPPPSFEELGLVTPTKRPSGAALTKMGKFRFQLLAEWIRDNFPPCRVADVGGGKGVLAACLSLYGFDATVIDPQPQLLPQKVRDAHSSRSLPLVEPKRLYQPFHVSDGCNFDILVGLHAHGSNLAMIESAAQNGSAVVLVPCCVIGEPQSPSKDSNWFSWLAAAMTDANLAVNYFPLNFKGQRLGMCGRSK